MGVRQDPTEDSDTGVLRRSKNFNKRGGQRATSCTPV